MAHPDAETVRAYIEAVGAGDVDRAGKLVAEDVVLHLPGRSPIAGDIRGRDALVAMLRAMLEASGGSVVPEIHDLLASDRHVVALVRRTVAGVDARAAVVYHVRDGRITEIWPHERDQYALDEAFSRS
jgi:uncharacterized protein